MACSIFCGLCIREFKRRDGTYLEGLYVGVVTTASYAVGFFGDVQLLALIVELLGQNEEILPEFLSLLTQLVLPLSAL